MDLVKSIISAYWQSFDFGTRLSRTGFGGFALFFVAALAASQQLLGTVAVGLAVTIFPLPAALVRRGRDAGVPPIGVVFLLTAPLIAGMVLLAVTSAMDAVHAPTIQPQTFDTLVRLSAACSWALLIMIVFAPARDAAPSARTRTLVRSAKPPVPATAIDPVAQAAKAGSEAHNLSDRIAANLGVRLEPALETSMTAEGAKAALAPIVDTLARYIARYAHGVNSVPLDQMKDELAAAFEAGGWVPVNDESGSCRSKAAEVTRKIMRKGHGGPDFAKVWDADERAALFRVERDDLMEKSTGLDPSATCFALPGLPFALGVIRRQKPDYATNILGVELFLDTTLARAIWALARRPEIYMAFPEEFLLTQNSSSHVEKMLWGFNPRAYRDGLSTEFLIAKPSFYVRQAWATHAPPSPDAYVKFEMQEIMR